jgi:hypothetical protein
MAYDHQLSTYNELKGIEYYITYDTLTSNGVKVEGKPLVTQDIVDCQITWDIRTNYADGYIVLFDKYSTLSELFAHKSMKFNIKAKDSLDVEFSHTFSVTSITSEYSIMSKSAVKIEFVDMYYNYFNSLFYSKGYSNVTTDVIIKDMLTCPLSPFSLTKSTVFSKTKLVHENIVVPAHRSFANFIANREILDGFSFIQARNHIFLLNAEDLNNSRKIPSMANVKNGAKVIFTDMQNDHKALPFQVKTLKRLYIDNFSTNSILPVIQENIFDYKTKCIKYNTNINKKAPAYYKKNLVDISTYMSGALSTYGAKINEVYSSNTNDKFYSFKLLENSMFEITTDGSFILDIMQVVALDLDTLRYDVKLKATESNGLYYVVRVVDKFQGNHFNQIVTLGRAGYINGS